MIEIHNISKTYRSGDIETQALRDVSFTINDGEFVAIMGPSGSGKSTLMHILGALDTPDTGIYRLNSHDVSQLSDDELADVRKRTIGFVFQSFNLLPRATVLRNVTLPLVYDEHVPVEQRGVRARKALQNVGFDESHVLHRSNQLSGGQVQRVAIARALVNNPALILADEPTGNLDTKTGEIVLDTFQRLNDAGHTVILITHEADVAAHAKRTITIRDGKIVSDTTRI